MPPTSTSSSPLSKSGCYSITCRTRPYLLRIWDKRGFLWLLFSMSSLNFFSPGTTSNPLGFKLLMDLDLPGSSAWLNVVPCSSKELLFLSSLNGLLGYSFCGTFFIEAVSIFSAWRNDSNMSANLSTLAWKIGSLPCLRSLTPQVRAFMMYSSFYSLASSAVSIFTRRMSSLGSSATSYLSYSTV